MPITRLDYIEQYAKMHSKMKYGSAGIKHLNLILLACSELKIKSILDYGCGRGKLHEELSKNKNLLIHRYDPAIKEFSVIKVENVDLVVNTDVLEHIPEEDIQDVLEHISTISDKVFFSISNRLADKNLPNGENAHCTVKSAIWWLKQIRFYFQDAIILHKIKKDYCIILTWEPYTPSLYNSLIQYNELKARKRFNWLVKKILRM